MYFKEWGTDLGVLPVPSAWGVLSLQWDVGADPSSVVAQKGCAQAVGQLFQGLVQDQCCCSRSSVCHWCSVISALWAHPAAVGPAKPEALPKPLFPGLSNSLFCMHCKCESLCCKATEAFGESPWFTNSWMGF